LRSLRRRIARRRRQIDHRIHNARRELRRLASWRTHLKRYPGGALAAAFGVGLALSGGLGGRRLSRWIGRRMVRRAVDRAGRQFWREIERSWADAKPERDAPATEGDRGRA
jgi:hypothetical protein